MLRPPSIAVVKGIVSSCLRSPPRRCAARREPPPLPPPRRNCVNRSAKPPAPRLHRPLRSPNNVVKSMGSDLRARGVVRAAAARATGTAAGVRTADRQCRSGRSSLRFSASFKTSNARLDFLKLALGRRVVRIHVRMILSRQLAVGLLDVGRGGIAADAQCIVVVFGHSKPGGGRAARI